MFANTESAKTPKSGLQEQTDVIFGYMSLGKRSDFSAAASISSGPAPLSSSDGILLATDLSPLDNQNRQMIRGPASSSRRKLVSEAVKRNCEKSRFYPTNG